MKRVLLPIITSLLIGGLAGTAMAQAPSPTPEQSTVADGTNATAVGTLASDRIDDRNCLRDTGSRITAAANARERRAGEKQTHCAGSPGRSYSRDDLQRTGETNPAEALRKLDTSIR